MKVYIQYLYYSYITNESGERINIKDFEEKYQKSIFDEYDIKTLIKNNDLVKKKNQLYIHPDKLYIMNEILIKLI